MRSWFAPTVASLLIRPSIALSLTQQPLAIPDHSQKMAEIPRPVPGRNAASFTDGEDQIFETIHLVVSPKIPVVDEPILMYLLGSVPDVEGLSSARLNITMDWDANPQDQPQTIEYPLSETPWLRIRKRSQLWTPGNVLLLGFNELLADFTFLGIFTETSNYSVEIRVTLPEPDGRLLFGFNQTFGLKKTPW